MANSAQGVQTCPIPGRVGATSGHILPKASKFGHVRPVLDPRATFDRKLVGSRPHCTELGAQPVEGVQTLGRAAAVLDRTWAPSGGQRANLADAATKFAELGPTSVDIVLETAPNAVGWPPSFLSRPLRSPSMFDLRAWGFFNFKKMWPAPMSCVRELGRARRFQSRAARPAFNLRAQALSNSKMLGPAPDRRGRSSGKQEAGGSRPRAVGNRQSAVLAVVVVRAAVAIRNRK